MTEQSGIFIADPFGTVIFPDNKTIPCLRPFENDIGPLFYIKSKKAPVEFYAFFFQDAGFYIDTGISKPFNASAVYFLINILCSDNYVRDLVFNNEVGAGRCFAPVRAWFQVDVQGCMFEQRLIRNTIYGIYFRVRAAKNLVVSFTYYFVFVDYYTAYKRVWRRISQAIDSQFKASRHIFFVVRHLSKLGI